MTPRPRGRRRAAALSCALILACTAALPAAPREPALLATSIDVRVEGWEAGALAGELRRLLREALGRDRGGWVSLVPAGTAPSRLTVSVSGSPNALTARSVLSEAGATSRAASSHASGLALLVPVLAGDILSLWAGDDPAKAFEVGESTPLRVVSVSTASLAALGLPEGEITDIAYGPEGLVLATPGGPVSVDGLLRMTPQTARDLLAARRSPLAMPLARLQAPRTGLRIMLAADQSTLLFSDPSSGESSRLSPIGGPFAGLTAMPWGGFALWRASASGPAAEILVGSRRGEETTQSRFTVSPALVSAAASDYDGNVWLYDAVERRIRVFDPAGRETCAIKPLIGRAAAGLPQQIAVYPDGSFLIAVEGEVWRLDSGGVPIWRLASLDPAGLRSLPRSFRIALHGASGSFSLLDPQAREIHLFAERTGAGTETELGRLRAQSSPEELAAWCLEQDLAVVAADVLGAPAAGEPAAREPLRRRLARLLAEDRARATQEYAGHLYAALDLQAAEPAYAEAVELYRALRTSYPTEAGYGAAVEALSLRRQQIRETLLGFLEAGVSVRVPVLHPAARASLSVSLAPPSEMGATMEGVVAEIASSGYVRAATLPLGDLSGSRSISIPLELDADAGLLEEDTSVRIGIRLSGTVGRDVVARLQSVTATLSSRLRFEEGWYAAEPPGKAASSRVAFLAWLVATDDPCVARFAETILPASDTPLGEAALVYGLLGDVLRLRERAESGDVQTPRRTLHALEGSAEDALLLAASLLPGVGRAFARQGGATYLLIDTGLPLPSGSGPLQELASRTGRRTVLLPLAAPAAGEGASLQSAARRALEGLSAAPAGSVEIAWVGGAGAPVRSPYLPTYAIATPGLAGRASADALATAAMLEP